MPTETPSQRHELIDRFFDALYSGDVEKTERILAQDPSLAHEHKKDHFDASAMNAAASSGNKNVVDLLIRHGASVNDGSDWWAGSFSPLMSAVLAKDQSMIEHLIAKGAKVTAYEASAMGDIDRLKAALEQDPESANMRGGDGQTPLHVAANVQVARLLIERGANLETKDIDHVSTPAQYAMSRPEVAEFLLTKGAKGDPFLYSAVPNSQWLREVLKKDPKIIDLRIGQETFPTSPPAAEMIYAYIVGIGCTPLHVAAHANLPENINILIEAGAHPNGSGGYDDATPLHQAAWNDSADAIRALLGHGADINIPSGSIHQNSPLGWAIVGGSLSAVETLLEFGATVWANHRDEAEAGVEGEFDRFKRVFKEDRKRIFDLISKVP
jgi:ankyrin repeat protein